MTMPRSAVPLALAVVLLAAGVTPVVSAAGSCVPSTTPEGNSLQRVSQRAAAGPVTFYVVSGGAPTIGQSTFELWEEWNGLDGLQKWDDCGDGADRFVLSFCAFRTGVVGALECPALTTSDLADYALDHA